MAEETTSSIQHIGKRKQPEDKEADLPQSSKRSKKATQASRSGPEGHVKPESNLAAIELLPPEILEMIFICSENVEFPLASPHLGSVLSNEYVYIAFCLQAIPASTDGNGNATLQSEILSRRWMKWELWNRISDAWDDREKRIGAPASIYMEYSLYQPVDIPSWLLEGPFHEDKVDFLAHLIDWGAMVDDSMQDKAYAGLREAILEGNVRAVDNFTVSEMGLKVDVSHLLQAIKMPKPSWDNLETLVMYLPVGTDCQNPTLWIELGKLMRDDPQLGRNLQELLFDKLGYDCPDLSD
ncbi:MAG: hypothetical protein M1817_001167 [Caeruleum heppii]|nr:MAG: hypothetical protein M1817_001167 [Caeruleum heppii]